MRRTTFFVIAILTCAGCEPIDTSRSGGMSDPAMRKNDSPPTSPSAVPANPKSDPDAPAPSATPGTAATDKPAAPDNTAVNERDAAGGTKTAIDQKETQRDVNLTADIRKLVIAAENMSVNARNVKIITEDGKVVLRGPVNSDAEKQAIDKMARDVAGKDNVENQIEVVESKP